MKFARAAIGGLVLAAAPLAAMAEGLSYSYVEADYVDIDADGASGDGFGLRGSVGFLDNLFAFADYTDSSVNVFDLTTIAVGVGGHYPLSESLDATGRIGYTELDLDTAFGSGSDDGYLLSLGLRGQFSQIELEGNVIYTDYSELGGDTEFEVAGRWNFTEMFSAGIGYRSGDEVDTFFAGVRLSW